MHISEPLDFTKPSDFSDFSLPSSSLVGCAGDVTSILFQSVMEAFELTWLRHARPLLSRTHRKTFWILLVYLSPGTATNVEHSDLSRLPVSSTSTCAICHHRNRNQRRHVRLRKIEWHLMVSVPNCSSPGLVQHAFHDQKVGSEAQFSECRHGLDLRAVALPLLQKPEAFKKKVLPQFDSKKSLGSVFNASSAGSNSFCSWRVVSQSFAGNFHNICHIGPCRRPCRSARDRCRKSPGNRSQNRPNYIVEKSAYCN